MGKKSKIFTLLLFIWIFLIPCFAQRYPARCRNLDDLQRYIVSKDTLIRWPRSRYEFQRSARLQINSELMAIIPDFLINDYSGDYGTIQYTPDIDVNRDGRAVAVWTDLRNGYTDIYVQMFSSDGSFDGANFLANDLIDELNQYSPVVAVDREGDFVVVWKGRDGKRRVIRARCFQKDGTPKDGSFIVSSDYYSRWLSEPVIAMDDSGNFAIAWTAVDAIFLQLYEKGGARIGNNICVSEGDMADICRPASIAAGGSGRIVVTWGDGRNDNFDIYAQIFDEAGNPIGVNFRVNESIEVFNQSSPIINSSPSLRGNEKIDISDQFYPSVAMIGNGNFLITWTDCGTPNDGDDDVYARVYREDGTPVTGSFIVNSDGTDTDQYYSEVLTYRDTCFIVYWLDRRNGENDVYAQLYTDDGKSIGQNFELDYSIDRGSLDYDFQSEIMNIVSNEKGELISVFTGWRSYYIDEDVYIQRFDISGSLTSDICTINDDKNSSNQYNPSIIKTKDGNFYVIWLDKRNGTRDIYYRSLSNMFVASGMDNIRLDSFWYDRIAADDYGNVLALEAVQVGSDKKKLNGRFYNLNSGEVVNEFNSFKVIDGYYDVSLCNNGHFWLVWVENDTALFCQRFLINGQSCGNEIVVDNTGGKGWISDPKIAVNEKGNFVICWVVKDKMYGEIFSSDGNVVVNKFRIDNESSKSEGSFTYYISDIDMNSSGSFIVGGTFIQLFDSNGKRIGDNIIVNDEDSYSYNFFNVSIDDDGKCVVVWDDRVNWNWEIYGRRIWANGTSYGGNFRITNTSARSQVYPDVIVSGERIYTVWEDNRVEGRSWDIWANILDWDNPDNEPIEPSSDILCQNYPNPFNNYTVFYYTIPEDIHVTLTVYDMQGKVVKRVVDKNQEAGSYTVIFNPQNIPSGIYIYTIKAGRRVKSKKMVLVK